MSVNQHNKRKNMFFEYNIMQNDLHGDFSVKDDKSLLYSIKGGDFSILLGDDWRFELNVDGNTGKCINIQGLLMGLIEDTNLGTPKKITGNLFFFSDEKLISGTGCQYFPFESKVFYDPEKQILCIGKKDITGTAIEFADKIVAVIFNGDLKAIYLDLKGIPKLHNIIFSKV